MKFATFRRPGGTFTGLILDENPSPAPQKLTVRRLDEEHIPDVGALLALPPEIRDSFIADAGEPEVLENPVYDTLIPFPSKVLCIGLNYRNHIVETGLELPEYPTIFTKFGQTLTSATAKITIPEIDHRLDYEGELAIVIGAPAEKVTEEEAQATIAGYAVSNDISLRGLQGRTTEWTQGKILEDSTPVGPWLVTTDEYDAFAAGARITTTVNGEVRQSDAVSDLVFSPTALVSYISQIITLLPGDLILTGTPGGVALAMKDPETGRRPWLKAGDVVETSIEGLGSQRNVIR